MAADHHIPIRFLRECFAVDENYVVRWRERPFCHFPSARAGNIWNARYPGRKAGFISRQGYLRVGLKYAGKRGKVLVHRIVWALTHGEWPSEIDHWDGNPLNNDIGNLFEVHHHENAENMAGRRGYYNVDGKWRAHITANGERISLGRYATKAEARAAYLEGKKKYHRYRPVPRF
jgi:hypothetical protein